MLKEASGNIWDMHDSSIVVITTNGFVKKNGEAVMGAGVAKEAKQRYPKMPMRLGSAIKDLGNIPIYMEDYNLLTFPVKHNWWEPADTNLINESAKRIANGIPDNATLEIPRPGCGNGKLDWYKEVKPIMLYWFNDDPRVTFWSY